MSELSPEVLQDAQTRAVFDKFGAVIAYFTSHHTPDNSSDTEVFQRSRDSQQFAQFLEGFFDQQTVAETKRRSQQDVIQMFKMFGDLRNE